MFLSEPDTDRPPDDCANRGDEGKFIREILERIGDKWSLLVIGNLYGGPMRFTALHHVADGISQRMLTLTLRHLQRDGLITRTVYAEVPPRVEYELTDLGRSLTVPVRALVDWAADNAGQVREHRDVYGRLEAAERERKAASARR
jgi:DNA-binding HxlR family transcriptional regulator